MRKRTACWRGHSDIRMCYRRSHAKAARHGIRLMPNDTFCARRPGTAKGDGENRRPACEPLLKEEPKDTLWRAGGSRQKSL